MVHLDGVKCIAIGIRRIYACNGFYYICSIWITCAFEIWFEMLLLCNFHDGINSYENILLYRLDIFFVMVCSHGILYFL